jgi:MoaA/NifB/PqqE/SkfB family radical SAM enzyme
MNCNLTFQTTVLYDFYMGFLERGTLGLVHSTLTKRSPLYVQYYITARCNLRCQQCNVIYANSDVQESSTEKSIRAITNLGKIGTNVLLFTGGEPFMRKDLPILVESAIQNKIHPRIQTNGLASMDSLKACVDSGSKDISISLDSLLPDNQDFLNGEFDNSWSQAIQTISNVSRAFPVDAFCAFGCVFSPYNFREVTKVIKFATLIGWHVSLVPAHSTLKDSPRAFSTFDQKMIFPEHLQTEAISVIDQIIEMKKSGLNVYDSIEFLENMKLFVQQKPLTWREKNNGMCDAGTLYFALTPDSAVAACCDFRLDGAPLYASDPEFVTYYQGGKLLDAVLPIIKSCSGCLYGSYPEISISARFVRASLERFKEFIVPRGTSIIPLTENELRSIAAEVVNDG